MRDKALVWYASYGSNLSRERFLCYIVGGTPEGALKRNQGTTDPTLPQEDKPIRLPYALYFAQRAASWQNGGVAFIDGKKEEHIETLGRMYLITEEQFIQVVRQENSLNSEDETFHVHLQDVKNAGQWKMNGMWYGRMVYVGEEAGYPIFTFTSPANLDETVELVSPSESYLKTIAGGLNETYGMTADELADYFWTKPGVSEGWSEESLRALLKSVK